MWLMWAGERESAGELQREDSRLAKGEESSAGTGNVLRQVRGGLWSAWRIILHPGWVFGSNTHPDLSLRDPSPTEPFS